MSLTGALLWGGRSASAFTNDPAIQMEADRIFAATGAKGGFVVHLGAGDARLTAALRKSAGFQVQGLERDPGKVSAARAWLLAEKLYGEVAVDTWREGQLPYIDNLVNLLVAEDLGGVTIEEVKRVLVPNGVAYLKQGGQWQIVKKPRPAEMDDWTHYYYDAKGNAASHDLLVAPPERLQWAGSPRWSRHHDRMSSLSAAVTSGGRLFYIMDEGSRMSALLPAHWALTARDAFNGTVLWKKEIPRWQSHLWPLKSGPTQLARRLVSDGDRIFVTLAIDAPVSQLDGATGEPLRVYETTKGAEEILHVNGILYVLVNPQAWSLEEFAPKFNTGDQKRVETEFNWDEKAREVQAVEVATGRLLWKKQGKFAPLTLATDGRHLIFHDGDKIVCLDASTGAPRWASPPAGKRKLFEYNYGPRLLLHENVALYAGGDGAMKSFDADNGKELWSAPHSKSGYRSPEDLIVAAGLVWNAPTISGNMSGEFVGRDPRSGETKVRFPPDVDTYWFHHRCYIAKATDRFIIPSRTGIEFVDLKAKHWNINHWVRSSCLYGTLPANGLTYAGPHNCACYPEAKLDGYNALAPHGTTPHPAPPPETQRLERGPAYDSPLGADSQTNDWPMFRHDSARSGFADQPLTEDLGKAWDIPLGGRLSALTIADGKGFVAQIDTHTVHALDLGTGQLRWHFITGGRVDSPPTYWKGRLFFGSHDGCVYCVRASDGALVWRYRASADRRHFAFEQVESVWPIPGSVLVDSNIVSFVAGRSMFLDGGLRFMRLNATTGQKLVEEIYDNKDPETGGDLQKRIKTLQMPVGLNDSLSTDGKWIYLRTQKIGPDGKRVDIGPVSGNAIEQGAAQKGEGAHLFAPMGFLDDSWFHRSYWVYGKSFAGGYNGYFQAGKYAPSGRILVFDDEKVYGYGREPQYFKWTTTMQHQLFSASRIAPGVQPQLENPAARRGAAGARFQQRASNYPGVRFPQDPRLDPAGKPVTVEVWALPESGNGVLVAHGGPANGYALALRDHEPVFYIRAAGELGAVVAGEPLGQGWHHIAGVLETNRTMHLYVDGTLAASGTAPALIPKRPVQPLEFGVDSRGSVGDYEEDFPYTGLLDEVAIYFRALSLEEIQMHTLAAGVRSASNAIIACSFDRNDARDESGHGINGVLTGVDVAKGRRGAGLWFHKLTPSAPALAKQGSGTNSNNSVPIAPGAQPTVADSSVTNSALSSAAGDRTTSRAQVSPQRAAGRL
ncbi:MAG: PQQ-binding-like beta-propeller repeat protein, partial [Verrucomicrobia bacterium]|nr:PQQ-binding-like beta-propeller repeat protein [Verrucomicrobiota bacterium]